MCERSRRFINAFVDLLALVAVVLVAVVVA
jgi:hypothetical protein